MEGLMNPTVDLPAAMRASLIWGCEEDGQRTPKRTNEVSGAHEGHDSTEERCRGARAEEQGLRAVHNNGIERAIGGQVREASTAFRKVVVRFAQL